jgi:DNA topoisomerase VI subunit A
MDNQLLLLILLSFLPIFGYSWKRSHGELKKENGLSISEVELNQKLGKKATIVQFSTTFCSECRTAKAIINDVVKDIRSTPTTIFLDSKGFEIARAKGAPKRDQLIKAIKAI